MYTARAAGCERKRRFFITLYCCHPLLGSETSQGSYLAVRRSFTSVLQQIECDGRRTQCSSNLGRRRLLQHVVRRIPRTRRRCESKRLQFIFQQLEHRLVPTENVRRDLNTKNDCCETWIASHGANELEDTGSGVSVFDVTRSVNLRMR